jgi:hypothetical protein
MPTGKQHQKLVFNIFYANQGMAGIRAAQTGNPGGVLAKKTLLNSHSIVVGLSLTHNVSLLFMHTSLRS